MNRLIIFFLAFCLLSAVGCRKKKEEEKWKLPTEVGIKMDINRAASSNGALVFTGGTIALSSFTFSGEREQGDDPNFSESFAAGLDITFSSTAVIGALDYDIPQGTYTSIEIEFDTYEGGSQNCLVVEGTYTHTNSTVYPLLFEFNSSETFEIFAEAESGSSTIVLNADQPATALIELDPVYWFATVSTNQLDNADVTDIGGVMTILINGSTNENIFDIVADRIDESAETVFN